MTGPLPAPEGDKPRPQRIAVIGAGAVGLGAALFLQRDGHAVTLIDRGEPGRATSYGNAGGVVVSSCLPLGTPGMLKKIPKMLLDPNSPLVIRWSYLPKIAPWLVDLLRTSSQKRVEAVAPAMANLGLYAGEAWTVLARQAGVEEALRPAGWLKVYRTREGLEGTALERRLAAELGIKLDYLNPDELRQLEPNLAPIYQGALFNPDSRFVVNPGRMTTALAADFVQRGGVIEQRAVADLTETEMGVSLATDGGPLEFERVVVAAGAWSRLFRDRLGVRPKLDTERGYHLMLETPERGIARPVSESEKYITMSPMEEGLRVSSLVEFGGLDLPPDYRRMERALPEAVRALPSLRPQIQSRWMGYRPSHPDSLPVIGPAPRMTRVICAFGHAHLGLTQGPVTGRLVADLVAGREPLIPLAPYTGDRVI